MDPTTPQEEAKKSLLEKLDTYVDEKVVFAGSMVVANAAAKIEDGDVVLTYAHSSVVLQILEAARQVRCRLVSVELRALATDRSIWAGIALQVLEASRSVGCSLPQVSGQDLRAEDQLRAWGCRSWKLPGRCTASLAQLLELKHCWICLQAGKTFRVVVADGRPHMEGRKLLQQLLRSGISATYCLLNALTYVMKVLPQDALCTTIQHRLCILFRLCRCLRSMGVWVQQLLYSY